MYIQKKFKKRYFLYCINFFPLRVRRVYFLSQSYAICSPRCKNLRRTGTSCLVVILAFNCYFKQLAACAKITQATHAVSDRLHTSGLESTIL